MKQFKIFIIGFLSLTLVSCELNLLSEVSLDAEKELNEADVQKLLNGLYNKMVDPSENAGYFTVMCSEILSDNFQPVKFQWFQVQDAFEHNISSDDILNDYHYVSMYNAIMRANTVLRVPSATESHKARAKYCRALTFLRLTDLYEDVPYTDESYVEGHIARSRKAFILERVVEDLRYAQEYAPEFSKTNVLSSIEPTSEAATALLARVYRMQGKIAEAGKLAEKLITEGKFSLADNPLNRSSEMIMNFASLAGIGNAEWGWIMDWDAQAWNCFAASEDLLKLVKGGDTREVLFDFAGAPEHNNFVFSTKYQLDSNADLIVSRIAEMYLISAEAGNASRLTEFQAKRKSSLTLDEERRLELSFEWVRWSDLKLKGETYRLPFPSAAVEANNLIHEYAE